MRKLLTIVAVLLIATALLGPGLTGRLTERAVIENNDALAASLPDWLMLVEQRFDRGWFTSTSQYRLVLTDQRRVAMFAQRLGVGEFADQPAITVDSVVAHGPLVGLVTPALGRVQSRFLVDGDDGRKRLLPFTLTSTLGLTGHTVFVGKLSAGGISNDRLTAEWADIEVTQRIDNKLAQMSIEIVAPSLSLMPGPGRNTTRFDDLEIDTKFARNDGRLEIDSTYTVGRSVVDSDTTSQTRGTFDISDIPLRAMPALREPMREIMSSGIGVLPDVLQAHIPELMMLLDGNLTLAWVQQTRSDAGDIDLDFDIQLPTAASLSEGNPQAVLEQIIIGASGSLNIKLSTRYADKLAANSTQMYEQLTMMRGTGVLAPDASGDYLVADIDYAGGSLSVNGIPMPVSLPPTATSTP